MIYCGACGAQNEEPAERCTRCGARLALPPDEPELDPAYIVERRTSRLPRAALAVAALLVLLLFGWLVSRAGGAGGGAPVVARATPPPSPRVFARVVGTPLSSDFAPPPTATPTRPPPTATSPPRRPDLAPSDRLVFSSNRDVPGRKGGATGENREIYSVRADGSGLARLTAEPGYDGQPVWAPGGNRIAFVSERTGKRQVWLMGADGANPRRLTDHPAGAANPDWSPDGRLIAYEAGSEGRTDLWTIPAAGGEPVRLTSGPGPESAPVWSPDGKRLAYMAELGGFWQVWVMDADGLGREQLTGGPVDHRYPRWTPDGRRILYNTRTPAASSELGQIYAMDADGARPHPLTHQDEGRNGMAFPSPDGRYVAFNSDREDGNFEIYTMRPDGSEVRRVTRALGDDFDPAWSR